jgi:hypothetical protein
LPSSENSFNKFSVNKDLPEPDAPEMAITKGVDIPNRFIKKLIGRKDTSELAKSQFTM